MKKGICKLILLCALLVLTGLIPERQTNAAEEYTYYITFNQIYQYEITKEQFESIRGNWNSLTPEGVLEIARQIVPEDQIPSPILAFGQCQKIVRKGNFRRIHPIKQRTLFRTMVLLFRRESFCAMREKRKS
mgnify:CR=1 FL=1